MKKGLKSILLILFIIVITIILPVFMDSVDLFGTEAKADNAGWKETEIGGDPETTPTGTTKDPFIVLEIVPNKAMTEISYLVAGEEPIEQQLFNKYNAPGELSFLGGAITPYDSYVEKPIVDTSHVDTNYKPRTTYYTKNGYFKYVGSNNGGQYQPVTGQAVFERVANGTGSYKAKLKTENTAIYDLNSWLTTNEKNVNAYFLYGKPDSNAPTTAGYEPCSVTRNTENKGDYDYNVETKIFSLNKGKGEYDVLFSRSLTGARLYYMQSDYQIVDDFTGHYSWSVEYTAASGGNYNKAANGMTFSKGTGDQYTYVWVDAETEALRKPFNFYVENAGTSNEKIWVKGQKFEKYYEMNYNVTLVNNEFFKRFTLGISADNCRNYKVKVITMTPSELNKAENQSLLSRANMFYINDNYGHNYAYMNLYETKNQKMIDYLRLHPEQKFDTVKSKLNFATDDLSWSSTMKIFNRVVGVKADGSLGGYRAAILFDYKFFSRAINSVIDPNDPNAIFYAPYRKNVTVSFSWSNSSATVVNMAKLFIMVYQRDPVQFYKMFLKEGAPYHIDTVSSSYNSTGTTGSFRRPDSTATGETAAIEYTFWNGNTFCPYMYDDSGKLITTLKAWTDEGQALLKKNIPNFNVTATPTDIIANVLTINGQDIFTDKYMTALSQLPPDAIEAAKIYAASQNGGVVPASISIANCLQLITNKGTGYGNSGSGGSSNPGGENGTSGSNLRTYISVLNIEPTADYAVSESNIKTIMAGYSKSVEITSMTSAEFNSSILDINTHYDMIYIGGGVGRFNRAEETSTDLDGIKTYKTLFNNSAYNGSYYNKGDNIKGPLYSAGNDISQQKQNEMKNFLKAGYPIVLENSIYTLTCVRNDTNLYRFLQTAIGSTPPRNVLNYYNYKKDTDSRIQFMANLMAAIDIVRPMIRMVQPILTAGSEYNYIYVDPATDILNIEFAILPRDLVADRTIKYNAYLYLDYNEDGIFSSGEELTAVPSDGSSNTGLTESKFKAYLYSYDMSKYNGVYQWQVKVVRQYEDADGELHDTEIRSEITGYAACTRREAINILQITDNPTTDTNAYSLENKVNDSASLIRKYAGYGSEPLFTGAEAGKLMDYDLVFHTMSVKDFLEQYKSQPYTDATAATANRLADYHVLILDNQSDQITNENGALKNIKAEIAKGLGIVFTKGAVNQSNQSSYFSTNLFVNLKTYPKLCRITSPDTTFPYYIFDFKPGGLISVLNQEATYQTTFLTKTNEGPDTQYPYKIGKAIRISDNSYEEDATIDYSRITSDAPLIGWYALSDERSPIVRSQGLVMDTTANTYTGIYSTSPNDTKNNYYLFNMGKIYFTGIQLKQADIAGNDSEIKLFINTIIATYKTSGRILAKAPVIAMKNPPPVGNVITLTKTDVGTKTEIPFIFEITSSSSHMDLSLLWNGSTSTTGNWNKEIYKVSSLGELTRVTDLSNISNGSYAVKIPVTELIGSHKLTINAKNKERKQTMQDTMINYAPDPVAISIINEDLVKNVDNGLQYLYIDIDYDETDRPGKEANYLAAAENIKLQFKVEHVSDVCTIQITDADGNSISIKNDRIYPATTTEEEAEPGYKPGEKTVANGSYYISIPASVINSLSSRDITITAKVSDTEKASTSVKLLRRSMFRLD